MHQCPYICSYICSRIPYAVCGLFMVLSGLTGGCGTSQPYTLGDQGIALHAKEALQHKFAQKHGLTLETFDLNHDHKPDIFNFYQKGDNFHQKNDALNDAPVLRYKAFDLNYDGKIDLVRYYDDAGKLVVKEEIDLDFDGNVDQTSSYVGKHLSRRMFDFNYDGIADIIKFYEDGKLVRIEIDRNGDGQIDRWEYFKEGKLDRIGLDLTGDGKVDRWEGGSKE